MTRDELDTVMRDGAEVLWDLVQDTRTWKSFQTLQDGVRCGTDRIGYAALKAVSLWPSDVRPDVRDRMDTAARTYLAANRQPLPGGHA